MSLNIFTRSEFHLMSDSICLLAWVTQEAAASMRGFKAAIVADVVPRIRRLSRDRRLVYWRERQQGAGIYEALAVASRRSKEKP